MKSSIDRIQPEWACVGLFCVAFHTYSRRTRQVKKENAGESPGVHDLRVHLENYLRRTLPCTPPGVPL
jgi:hypothetical protein